jgi:hypothetical protein
VSGKRWVARSSLLALLAIVLAAAIGSTASAQIVVGQTAPSIETANPCNFKEPFDEVQISTAAGASYVVPTAGVITSWSTNAAPVSGQQYGFKVFRPLGGTSFLVVGHDGPRLLTPNALNTFPVAIPVQAGDHIGINIPATGTTACSFSTGMEGDVYGYVGGTAPDGATISTTTEPGVRLNVSATVLPPPTISSISPATGSIKGASVVIAGTNFAGVQGVSFGSVPASTFTVDSEGQITAKAPASKTLSKVPVTVTTVAGAATSAQTFAYEGCVVPKLKGKGLKAAKKKARAKDCKIGTVKKLGDTTAKSGKVVKQSPPPGKVLAPGSKINLTLKG